MSTPALSPLVEKIRAKYPGAYNDMDDAALTKAVLAKYPEYSDLAAPAIAKPSIPVQTMPESGAEKIGAGLAQAGDATVRGVEHLAGDVYDVSTPNIADQVLRRLRGLPNTLHQIPQKAVLAWLTAGGIPEGEAGEIRPAEEALTKTTQPLPTPDAEGKVAGEAPRPASTNLETPHAISGESALRQVLTGQDNKTLLQIARARGVDVAKEAQLKPGVADGKIINKIIDDFSDDELNEVQARYIEKNRGFSHDFGDIGKEAWKTLSLQTYFPELKIPAARVARTQAAISKAGSGSLQSPAATEEEDLTGILSESVKRARAKKLADLQ